MTRAGYLGLGSNVGDRRANLQAAVDALPAHGVDVLGSSSVYETEPVGEVLEQPDFLNACVRVRTGLEPEALLDACKAVERELGRASGGVRHGPRPIDVDLLLLGDETYRSERLALPHEQVTSRRFVLVPLLELAPELVVPGAGRGADALQRLSEEEGAVRRAGPPLSVASLRRYRGRRAIVAAEMAGAVSVSGLSVFQRRARGRSGGRGRCGRAPELEDGWKSSALDGSGLLCDRDAWVRVTDEAKSRRSGLH